MYSSQWVSIKTHTANVWGSVLDTSGKFSSSHLDKQAWFCIVCLCRPEQKKCQFSAKSRSQTQWVCMKISSDVAASLPKKKSEVVVRPSVPWHSSLKLALKCQGCYISAPNEIRFQNSGVRACFAAAPPLFFLTSGCKLAPFFVEVRTLFDAWNFVFVWVEKGFPLHTYTHVGLHSSQGDHLQVSDCLWQLARR